MTTLIKDNIKTQGKIWEAIHSLLNMTKPTIALLVVITTIPAILLSSESIPNPVFFLSTLLGTALASASAAIFNQAIEINTDSKMDRTKKRSLPMKKLQQKNAFIAGSVIAILALSLLYILATPLAAIIALCGHLFYVCIYTMYLKYKTPQNIVIGGASGAIGPLIGCASVTHSITMSSFLLFLIIFLWTPPHFWALSLKYKNDYAKAGIPMFPVVYGDEKTRQYIFLYTVTLIPVLILFYLQEKTSYFFMIPSFLLTLYFMYLALKLYKSKNNDSAMPLFHYSCIYAFAIFGILSFDRLFILVKSSL